ncbi:aminotransferase class IV [Gloeothece citriformis PCC 7424]|uniref:Aminotransferase class IV n=1 Tax=Gloeothece citriformis (strain PCC 7424) TaxID=65393 RepID=B7KJ53_GLOC7|nr:aminotransferase class IV [Gloeothece citriformis]ACK72137.1 aminotransferase class IV [Gloeothece citriformis PCC 7424]
MFWYNGQLIEGETLVLNVSDPGLIYGATVFTTVRVYDQSLDHPLTHWGCHCDRLSQSLERFGWLFPDWQRLKEGAEKLSIHYPVLRVVVFADGREWITGRNLPPNLRERQQQGIMGWVAEDKLFQRSLADHKTGNYLGAWLALEKARQFGAGEAILIDSQGNWLETSTGNLWGWKGGSWWTPVLDESILPGIQRSAIINRLKSQDIFVEENLWTPDFIEELEVIAYSNCVVEIIPFTVILSQKRKLTFNAFHPALKQLRINTFKN